MDLNSLSHLLESQELFSEAKQLLSVQAVLSREAISTSLHWIFEQCRELWPEDQIVAQTASSYLVLFLSKVRLRSDTILELLCWVSIGLACKLTGRDIDLTSLEAVMEAKFQLQAIVATEMFMVCLLYTSPSPRDS